METIQDIIDHQASLCWHHGQLSHAYNALNSDDFGDKALLDITYDCLKQSLIKERWTTDQKIAQLDRQTPVFMQALATRLLTLSDVAHARGSILRGKGADVIEPDKNITKATGRLDMLVRQEMQTTHDIIYLANARAGNILDDEDTLLPCPPAARQKLKANLKLSRSERVILQTIIQGGQLGDDIQNIKDPRAVFADNTALMASRQNRVAETLLTYAKLRITQTCLLSRDALSEPSLRGDVKKMSADLLVCFEESALYLGKDSKIPHIGTGDAGKYIRKGASHYIAEARAYKI